MSDLPAARVTADGVAIEPLYHEASSLAVAQREGAGWETWALVDAHRGSVAGQLEQARRLGAQGLWVRDVAAGVLGPLGEGCAGLQIAIAPGVCGRAGDVEGVEAAFAGGSARAPSAPREWSPENASRRVALNLDPVASAILSNRLGNRANSSYQELRDAAARFGSPTTWACSSLHLHAAGGDPVDELALVAASWLELMRRLEVEDGAVDALAAGTVFHLAVGQHLLTEIGKMRALREVLGRLIVRAGGSVASARGLFVHALTSPRVQARRGYRSNVLRATGQATAAVLGGADAVTVLPWDDRMAAPSTDSARLALQVANVLRLEARVAEMADPGAGSFAFESLTEQLALSAWRLLGEIEDEGGVWPSLREGLLRERLRAARARRREQRDQTEIPVVGSTIYPHPDEPRDAVAENFQGDPDFAPVYDEERSQEEGTS